MMLLALLWRSLDVPVECCGHGFLQYTKVAHGKGMLAAAGMARSPTRRWEVTALAEMAMGWSDG